MEKLERAKLNLAEAVKECMKTTPFESITVKQIAHKAGVSRQTFYRHFLDKYDLVNWYFDKLLDESFREMGNGKTVYEGLILKFNYIREEHVFFNAAFRTDKQNNLKEHDFRKIYAFYRNLIREKTGQMPSPMIDAILEMYCQASIYMTVKWVTEDLKQTPKELAELMILAMPKALSDLFEKFGALR